MTRELILGMEYEACLRSPLARASETADIVWSGRSGAKAPVDVYDLREIDLYGFEGLLKKKGMDTFGAQYKMWKHSPAEFEIDGHYPVRELWDRAAKVWGDVLLQQTQSKILVVAHNAVNQAMLASALGCGPEYFRRLTQSNCAISKVIVDENFAPSTGVGISLEFLNRTPDLPASKNDSIVLIHAPTSIEEEAVLTVSILELLQGSKVKSLMHSRSGASARLAEKIFDRCSRELRGQCPFELTPVDSVAEVLEHFQASENDEGTTYVIHDKDLCQAFLAVSVDMETGKMFNLSPGGVSMVNMKGGPAKDPLIVCVNHSIYLPRPS
jgi:probable phosphoglycerate mutase